MSEFRFETKFKRFISKTVDMRCTYKVSEKVHVTHTKLYFYVCKIILGLMIHSVYSLKILKSLQIPGHSSYDKIASYSYSNASILRT